MTTVTPVFISFRRVFDMFSDRTLSGWAKVGWSLVLVFRPWLEAFTHLVTGGPSTSGRQMAAAEQQQAAQDEYIKRVAGSSSPTDHVANSKSLLDSRAITQAELDTPKAKALA